MQKNLESLYRPDTLNASHQPSAALLRGVIEDLSEDTGLLHESTPETEFNDIAVNKYLDEEIERNPLLDADYRMGGLLMNTIVKRTYREAGRRLPQILPPHAELNRGINTALDRIMGNDETLLDARIAEYTLMKKEMPAFEEVSLVPDETSDFSRKVIAGIVDIANLYDYAQKRPPETLVNRSK